MSDLSRFACACSLVGAVAAATFADEIVCPVTDDTMIYARCLNVDRAENKNAGQNVDLLAGANNTSGAFYRSLLRFPLAKSGVTGIVSGKLVLTVSGVGKMKSVNGVPLLLYCIHEKNAAWQEGSSRYEYADVGEACWAALGRNRTPWYGEPGIGTNVGCRCAASTVTVAKGTTVGTAVELPLSAAALAAVQDWADGKTNAGFLLLAADEANKTQNAVNFASRQHATYAKPRLELTLSDSSTRTFDVSEDVFLLSSTLTQHADWNWGGRNCIVVGAPESQKDDNNTVIWQPSRAFLRFDCTAAAGCLVTGAVVRLVSGTSTERTADAVTLRAFALSEADAAWTEGWKCSADRSTGAAAEDGDLTWNYLSRNVRSWSEGVLPPGGVEEVASLTIDSLSSVRQGDVTELPLMGANALALVRQWIAGGVNAGLLLRTDEAAPSDGKRTDLNFASKENVTYAAPQLVLYTCPMTHVARVASADGFFYDGSDKYKKNEWGKNTTLIAGLNTATATYRSILRFDLAGGYTRRNRAAAATVSLTVADVAKKGSGPITVKLHLLNDGNAGWGEGTSVSGNTAATGVACWNWRNASATAWVGGAGIGISSESAGIDETVCELTVNASELAVGRVLRFPITSETALAKLDGWAWRADAANAGFYVTTDESTDKQNAVQFASREHVTESWRPQLSVAVVPRELPGTVVIVK